MVKKAIRPAIFNWRQTEPELILCAVRWHLRAARHGTVVELYNQMAVDIDAGDQLEQTRVSTSSRRPSAMRGRMRQLELSSGRAQTLPVQPPSCQGTRTVTWWSGKRRAPAATLVTTNLPALPSSDLRGMLPVGSRRVVALQKCADVVDFEERDRSRSGNHASVP